MTAPAQQPVIAAIYTRISIAALNDTTKTDEQERLCREVCARRGWGVGAVFTDPSRSAWQRNRTRPGWDAFLVAMRSGHFGAVATYWGDRLVRQPRDLEDLLDLRDIRDIMLASVSGQYDFDNSDHRMMMRWEVARACNESDTISRRMKNRNDRLRREGRVRSGGTGGRALCFETDGVTHRARDRCVIATHRETGEVDFIREAAARLLGGESMRSVLADLTARGLRSTAGNVIRQSAFRRTLLLPRMAGLMPDGEQKAAWEPVIDRGDWEDLRALMDSHPGNDWAGRGALYPLSGIALCDRCDHPMYAGERKSSAYKCPPGGCGNNRRDRRHLDAFVIAAVCEQLGRRDNPEPRQLPTTALDAEFRALAEQHAEAEAAVADPAQGRRLPLLLARLDSLDARLAELRDLAGGNARSRLLDQYAGTSEEEFRGLPLGVQRSLISACFTVRVKRASRRGPGFNPGDVDLLPR